MKTKVTPKIVTKGVCSFCKGEFDKPKMSQHLRNCKERKAILANLSADETKQKMRLFHIQAEGRYAPQYWMHLELPVECGKPATQVVAEYDIIEHAYCDECVKNLDEDEFEQIIEIENSPRVGIAS